MRAVQTPQGFRINTLRAAHEHSRTLEASVAEQITDDAMAVEAYGEQGAYRDWAYRRFQNHDPARPSHSARTLPDRAGIRPLLKLSTQPR